MDRATIEPAIRIVLTEIHSKLNEAARIEKPLRPARWWGVSPKAQPFRWISSSRSTRPVVCRMPPRY
jgi:hypothetical protein